MLSSLISKDKLWEWEEQGRREAKKVSQVLKASQISKLKAKAKSIGGKN
jgi:hypothetical protein